MQTANQLLQHTTDDDKTTGITRVKQGMVVIIVGGRRTVSLELRAVEIVGRTGSRNPVTAGARRSKANNLRIMVEIFL